MLRWRRGSMRRGVPRGDGRRGPDRQAGRELARAVPWIAADNPDASERLNDAVLDAARLLGGNALLGRAAPPPSCPAISSGY